jgi:hypothetical protein
VKSPFLTRLLFVSAALVVAFAAVFTIGEIYGAWPEAPAPFFRNADFVAGFLFVGAMVVAAFLAVVRSQR